ncbi:MAG: glycosyl hydrolase 2 galactose-binding domain-containing protein [Armatimonadota bacterium]
MSKTIDLNGTWKLAWSPLEGCKDVPICNTPIDATVPGDVHQDLVNAGILPEPLVGVNAPLHEWIEKAVFTYERDLGENMDFDRAELVFHGLDCIAEIFVDDQQVGTSANAFVPQTFDVTAIFKQGGRHRLRVNLDTGVQWAKRQVDGRYKTGDSCHERPYLRKPQFAFKWDWAPRLVTCGIWRRVELKLFKHAAIRDVMLCPVFEGDAATLRANVQIEAFEPGNCLVRLRVMGPGGVWQASERSTLTAGVNHAHPTVRIDPVMRWYPRGYGDQPMYCITVEIERDGNIVDEWSEAYGFREVALRQDPLSGSEKRFIINVNGIDIFCKGADWVPADSLPGRIPPEKYEKLVDEACEANFNMFRIWGGGIYESDLFYDLCDRRGILVWQDFMFACAEYPDDQPWFVENVRDEARKAVRRLRNHPCIVLWCGNNENDWIYGFMIRGEGKRIVPFYGQSIYHDVLPSICAELDPNRPYWPSSPYGGQDPNSESEGDRHAWNVSILNPDLAQRADIRNYRHDRGKFISEFGVISHALPRTILDYTGEGGSDTSGSRAPRKIDFTSPAYKFHDNPINAIGEGGGLSDWYQKVAFGSVPSDEMTYIYQSLLYQAMGYREAISDFRIRWPECGGSLFWMYADCWGTLGWTIVDYYLRRKPSFYWVRKAYAPVAVFVRVEGNAARTYVVNDMLSEIRVRLTLEVGDMKGPKETGSADLVVPANAVLSGPELACGPGYAFAQIEAGGKCISEDLITTRLPSEMEIPPVAIRADIAMAGDNEVIANLSSDGFAHFVWLDHPDGAVPTDNYFHMLPNRPRTVHITGARPEQVTVSALNRRP